MFRRNHLCPLILFVFLIACKGRKQPPASDIASSPEQLETKARDNIRQYLEFAAENQGSIGDSITLGYLPLLQQLYGKSDFEAAWSTKEDWKPLGDSMLDFLAHSKLYGLFPEDYHFLQIDSIRQRLAGDSTNGESRRDAALWAKADLMMTDAFFRAVKEIKIGRLPKDSITLSKDSSVSDAFYMSEWEKANGTHTIVNVIQGLEPVHRGYHELKAGIQRFLDENKERAFTPVPARGRDSASIQAYRRALQTRLYELGLLSSDSTLADSVTMADAIKRFQKQQGITIDGKAGVGTLRLMNLSEKDKFVRIAITLDKFKQLPDSMPARYVWVNIPGYSLQLRDNDTVKLVSKIVCGKPQTRTPLLTSAISEMITYPQWTIPSSIIEKEILPGIKRDSAYFRKKGYSIIDKEGNEVDPHSVDWSKYRKSIPYKVVQGSGDDNALGVLKFNFSNKYSVYLHDTNQRYLFAQAVRSLSHGCVRVQEWEQLAYSILSFDTPDEKQLQAREDSLQAWLGRKEKKSIGIRKRLPLFIRYQTCEARNGEIVFYDDIYGEDKRIRETYFAGK